MNKWKIMALAIIGPLSVSGCAATLSTAHARADFLAPSLLIVEDEPHVVHYHQVHKTIHHPPVIVNPSPKPAPRPIVVQPKPPKNPAPKPVMKPTAKRKPVQIARKPNGKKEGTLSVKKPTEKNGNRQISKPSFNKGQPNKSQPKAAMGTHKPKPQNSMQKNKKK